MPEIWSSFVLLILFCGSAAVGFYVRPRLPEAHRSHDATELVRLIVGMLVTFAAIVLGLLTTSVKTAFDTADRDRRQYATELTQLDQCLRNYGPETQAIRHELQGFVATVIVSTWPSEPRPTGVDHRDVFGTAGYGESVALGNILNQVYLAVRQLQPEDAYREKLAADCGEVVKEVIKQRWVLIEEARGSISPPFYNVIVFWLMVIFASFGLQAPRNGMVLVAVALCAICLTSAMFVILDMDLPYGGVFGISSEAMRTALSHMLQ